jgi:hypothetical protein
VIDEVLRRRLCEMAATMCATDIISKTSGCSATALLRFVIELYKHRFCYELLYYR